MIVTYMLIGMPFSSISSSSSRLCLCVCGLPLLLLFLSFLFFFLSGVFPSHLFFPLPSLLPPPIHPSWPKLTRVLLLLSLPTPTGRKRARRCCGGAGRTATPPLCPGRPPRRFRRGREAAHGRRCDFRAKSCRRGSVVIGGGVMDSKHAALPRSEEREHLDVKIRHTIEPKEIAGARIVRSDSLL